MAAESDLTSLLQAWSAGDEEALDALTPIVYGELHTLALRLFKGERAGHTMQPTALVNEAYEKLIGVDVKWQDRAHFFALSARMMRRLLVNHATARNAEKRGGEAISVTFEEMHHAAQPADVGILKLEEALLALAEFDQQQADLIELQYFAGLSFKEMEEVTKLSSSTLDRHLRMARAWLKANMADEA